MDEEFRSVDAVAVAIPGPVPGLEFDRLAWGLYGAGFWEGWCLAIVMLSLGPATGAELGSLGL